MWHSTKMYPTTLISFYLNFLSQPKVTYLFASDKGFRFRAMRFYAEDGCFSSDRRGQL